MFQVGEVKKWAGKYGITVKKQGDGYVWFEDKQTPSEPESLDSVVKSVFNKVTNNRYIDHQKSYRPEN